MFPWYRWSSYGNFWRFADCDSSSGECVCLNLVQWGRGRLQSLSLQALGGGHMKITVDLPRYEWPVTLYECPHSPSSASWWNELKISKGLSIMPEDRCRAGSLGCKLGIRTSGSMVCPNSCLAEAPASCPMTSRNGRNENQHQPARRSWTRWRGAQPCRSNRAFQTAGHGRQRLERTFGNTYARATKSEYFSWIDQNFMKNAASIFWRPFFPRVNICIK